jgi:hypothetical protein
MAFANFEYCHKEMEVRFQNNWDQPSVLFRWHSPNAHNSINETGIAINICPNRDDSDHVLIVTIDADLGDARAIRTCVFSRRSKVSKRSICNCTVVAL